MELSKKQIDRQDFVDNSIYKLLQNLNPSVLEIKWDIDQISQIREEIENIIVKKMNLCSEQEFYPYLEE